MSAAAGVVSAADLLAAAGASGPIAYKPDDLDYDLGLMAAFDPHPLDPAELAADKEEALLQSATDNAQLLVKHLFELATDVTEVGPVAMLPERSTKLPRWKPVPKAKPLTRWQKFALEKGIQKKKKSRMVWDEDAGEFKPRWGYKGANDDGTKDWLVEAKPGDDGTADPWQQKALEKKARVISNKLNQVKNLQRASRGADAAAGVEGDAALFNRAASKALPGAAAAAKALYVDPFAPTKRSGGALVAPKVREAVVPVTDGLAPAPRAKRARLDADASDGAAAAAAPGRKGSKRERSTGVSARVATTADGERVLVPAGLPSVPVGEGRIGVTHRDGKEARAKPSDTKAIKQARLKMAQVSTASMGKFDAALPGEPARPKDPKRHIRLANEVPAVTEAARHKDILRKILGGADDREIPSAGAAAAATIGSSSSGAGGRRGGRAEGGAGTGGSRGRSASAGGVRGRSASGGRKGGDGGVSGHKRKRS